MKHTFILIWLIWSGRQGRWFDGSSWQNHLPSGPVEKLGPQPTEFDGDRSSRGINFMGIICPGGQEVGDRTCSHMATLYGCCRWRPEVHYCKHSEPLVPNCSAHKTSFYATRNSNGSILKVKTSSLLEFVIVHDFYDPSVIPLFTHSSIYGTVALDVLPRAQSHHCTR